MGTLLTSVEINFKNSISQILFEKTLNVTMYEVINGCTETMGKLLEPSEEIITIGKHYIESITMDNRKDICKIFGFTFDETKVKTPEALKESLMKRISFNAVPCLKNLSMDQLLSFLVKVKAAKSEQH